MEATENATKLVDQFSLANQTFGMSAREAKIFALEMKGASEEVINQLRLQDELLVAKEANRKAEQDAQREADKVKREAEIEQKKRQTKAEAERNKILAQGQMLTERFLTPQERFNKQIAEYSHLLNTGAIDQTTYNRAVNGSQKELADAEKQLKSFQDQFRDNTAVLAGSAEFEKLLADVEAKVPIRFPENRDRRDINNPIVDAPIENIAGNNGANGDTQLRQIELLQDVVDILSDINDKDGLQIAGLT